MCIGQHCGQFYMTKVFPNTAYGYRNTSMTNKLARSWENGAGAGTLQSHKQGCVLSPRLFSATLEWALRNWKNASQGAGIDLGDGLPNLMELRFADDILLFANSGPEAAQLLDKLITAVGRAGLILNAEKR